MRIIPSGFCFILPPPSVSGVIVKFTEKGCVTPQKGFRLNRDHFLSGRVVTIQEVTLTFMLMMMNLRFHP